MPLYDYRCERCGETVEVRQKFSDAILTMHEDCGGKLERLISAPALQFKGTGFYLTDYGRNGKKPEAVGSGGKPESKSEAKADSKSESKAETKTESKSDSRSDSKKSETKSATKPAPAASSDK